MSYKLVIAEKPSVAQSIAKVIGADKREDGYLTKPIAVKLLSDGKVPLKGCKSKKTGKTYDTTVIMTVDENQRAVFELNFEKGADKYGKSKNKKD